MTREAKLAGTFLFVLGLFGLYVGARFLLLGEPPATNGSSCKAICGLTLLFTELLGRDAGRILGGTLWLVAGIFLCSLARAAFRR